MTSRIGQVHTVRMSKGPAAAGIVLDAGAGIRYGMPKVLAHEGEWLPAAVTAPNVGGGGEALGVLGAAIAAPRSTPESVVLLTVDPPDIGAAVVRRVLAAAGTSASGLARAYYGGRPGHPVVVARRHWADLLERLHGDDGARPFLRARSDVVAVDCADLATGADIDEDG